MKEVKEVKNESKSFQQKNLYLTILNLLNKGYHPNEIRQELNISKQRLHYHTSKLSRLQIIKRVGYGTWEVLDKDSLEREVKNIITSIRVGKIPDRTRDTFKNFLIKNELNKCLFCLIPNKIIETHHIIPRSEGGSDDFQNLIPICPTHHRVIHTQGLSREMKDSIVGFHNTISKFLPIRGHAFMFKLQIPKDFKNWDKREERLKKLGIEFKKLDNIKGSTQSFKFEGKKVWLTNKSIIVFDRNSYFNQTANNSKNMAISNFNELIQKLENKLKTKFSYGGKYKFKVSRSHYSLIKDLLAKQYDKEGKKLEVYGTDGLWFVIDNSFNLHESETIHPQKSEKDMDEVIKPFLNDLRANPTTFSEVKGIIGSIVKIQEVEAQKWGFYAQNIESHTNAIKQLNEGIGRLFSLLEEPKVKRHIKKKMGFEQTHLRDFI